MPRPEPSVARWEVALHIPDSAVSPATSLAAAAAMTPVWHAAGRRLKSELSTAEVPLLSVGAAFCFTVMMFNIPVPGGTTVHPVGAVLLAIALGPWAAVVGVSVALAVQALFFADGGVLALGANCFTMAFAMPFVGYLVYRVVAAGSPHGSARRVAAAGIGAYAGVNVAALLVAVLLGVQPALHHDAVGRALYFPFDLRVTIPAIMAAHLTVAGAAEGAVTALAVRYLASAGIPLYGFAGANRTAVRRRAELVWIALGALVALTPVGLLATGEAWGEWSAPDVAKRAGYLPAKLDAAESGGWHGFNLLPDYLGDRGPGFYVLAALLGVGAIAGVTLAGGRLLRRDAGDASGGGSGGTADDRAASSLHAGEVPEWMLSSGGDPAAGDAPAPGAERGVGLPERLRGGEYVARTIGGLADATREALAGERWAREDGLLQRVDARVKIVGLLGLLPVVSLARSAAAIALLAAVAVVLTLASRIPLRLVLGRVWLAVGLFAGAVCLPAMFSFATPGAPLVVLSRSPYVAVTAPGLLVAASLAARTATAVSLVVLLTLTSRWSVLLRAFRVLRVPRLFLLILEMSFRYIAVVAQCASETFVARRSRSVGRLPGGADHRFLGGAIGALFGRSLALSGEVHSAMMARGWTGEARALATSRVRAADMAWLACIALLAAAALVMP